MSPLRFRKILWTALAACSLLPCPADGFIDRHIARAAGEYGLGLSPPAGYGTLARRLSFDLAGLPPPLEWYREKPPLEKMVDSLLASPHFGERMASMWMGVARYAEDQAHQVGDDVKHFYPNAYLYRQWVVDAFNRDLPFERFVQMQLAADLIAPGSREDLPALGFLGLGPKYYERNRLQVKATEWEDRVDTVTRGFLGLTVACARCHDHKFDPVSTEDYYALAGVFASIELANVPYNLPEGLPEDSPERRLYTAHVVEEARPTDLNVFIRGDVERKGPVVPRSFLPILSQGEPPPFSGSESGRRELAQAISANPQAARVYVNRIWQELFGQGLVRTPSNFGSLGERATHPELLEELARRFQESGGSTKWLVRQLVLSDAYRQASAPRQPEARLDPDNRHLWRMNRRRMTVEMWRDSLLSASLSLDPRGGRSMELSDPENRRRTLYGRISRLKLDPLLARFDYPDPNVHSGRRSNTTTSLQKLFALNSPLALDLARELARRLSREADSDAERVRLAYRILFFREPGEQEEALALDFLQSNPEDGWDLYAQALMSSNEALYID